MWSVVVVSASVATDDYKPQANFVFSSTCLCSLMGVSRDHRIPNSASHHFSKIHFFEKQTKKKRRLLFRYVFFISQNLYCFKNSWANIPMTCFVLFFFVEYVDLRTVREVFNNLTPFSIVLNWMTELRVFCVRASVWTRVTDMTGCIANWFNPVLQVRKSSVTC